MRSVVVLPHPDGPSKLKNSPSAISSERSSTAATSPNSLETRSRRTSISVTGSPFLPANGGMFPGGGGGYHPAGAVEQPAVGNRAPVGLYGIAPRGVGVALAINPSPRRTARRRSPARRRCG